MDQKEPTTGSLIIGYDFTNGADVSVLVVGRKKPDQSIEVINAFQGKEAEELYYKLTAATMTPAGRENNNV